MFARTDAMPMQWSAPIVEVIARLARDGEQPHDSNGRGPEPPPVSGPEDYGFDSKSDRKANGQDKSTSEQQAPEPEPCKPWWRDPATIPPRQFLFGQHYIRRHIGATIGAGGRAKTTLGTAEAIGMALGRDLMTKIALPSGPLRVWVLNAEEDQDELDRRFAAVCQLYKVSQADLGGRLFVQSIRKNPWRLATVVKSVPTLDQ